jgi:hypothetical protein
MCHLHPFFPITSLLSHQLPSSSDFG